MRLIGDQDVADGIMAYYAYTKFLDDQRQLYITSVMVTARPWKF